MTIEYVKGDLLSVTEGIIIHGCNTKGVMGAGVAKQIKDKYPMCFDIYSHSTKLLGSISWYRHHTSLYVGNAITQEYYSTEKRQVNYVAIAKVFDQVCQYGNTDLAIHFPKIGAGLGGGDWNIIEELINDSDPYRKFKKICWEL